MSYDEKDFELDVSIVDLINEKPTVHDDRPVARCNYKNLKKGDRVDIIETGRDYFGIKLRGSVFRVPKWVL
jgi:hypothetical protein